MNTFKSNKLNRFLQNHLMGSVVTTNYLADNNISNDLARIYVASDWLTRIGRGAYIRSGDRVEWHGALFAIQSQLKFSVHAGGLTALQMKGLGHYLSMEHETVHLFSDGAIRLPDWFTKYDWGTPIKYHNLALFNLFSGTELSDFEHKGFEIQISSPERATFEMLSQVKTNEDFDAMRTIFDGLTNLRPKKMQHLLVACVSIKVKRLLLWMASECNHPWLKHIDMEKVELGRGKRLIYRGGHLDKKYQITVPKKYGEEDV